MATETPYIGQIELFGFNFPPRGWAPCNGQLLAIANDAALFSLLGTMYGGDGVTTFALPNLNRRVAVGIGTGPGLSPITQGQVDGAEFVTLSIATMPGHSHTLNAQSGVGTTSVPGTSTVLAQVAEEDGTPARSYSSAAVSTTLSANSVGTAGSGLPVPIRNPYLGLQYAIAIEGIYPSRN
jgi:microcystin-dependent protein